MVVLSSHEIEMHSSASALIISASLSAAKAAICFHEHIKRTSSHWLKVLQRYLNEALCLIVVNGIAFKYQLPCLFSGFCVLYKITIIGVNSTFCN